MKLLLLIIALTTRVSLLQADNALFRAIFQSSSDTESESPSLSRRLLSLNFDADKWFNMKPMVTKESDGMDEDHFDVTGESDDEHHHDKATKSKNNGKGKGSRYGKWKPHPRRNHGWNTEQPVSTTTDDATTTEGTPKPETTESDAENEEETDDSNMEMPSMGRHGYRGNGKRHGRRERWSMQSPNANRGRMQYGGWSNQGMGYYQVPPQPTGYGFWGYGPMDQAWGMNYGGRGWQNGGNGYWNAGWNNGHGPSRWNRRN